MSVWFKTGFALQILVQFTIFRNVVPRTFILIYQYIWRHFPHGNNLRSAPCEKSIIHNLSDLSSNVVKNAENLQILTIIRVHGQRDIIFT
jgi:hypothetical protein